MGCYINPANESKEQFLEREGVECNMLNYRYQDVLTNQVAVVLVNNGPFTAAMVCYSEGEFDVATERSRDLRPKRMFVVQRSALYAVSDLALWEKM